MSILLFVMIVACVFLALEALSVPGIGRLKWGWAGLFLWAVVVAVSMF